MNIKILSKKLVKIRLVIDETFLLMLLFLVLLFLLLFMLLLLILLLIPDTNQ